MRILQVYKDIFPRVSGGIERYIRDLSGHCAERGHQVEVLVAGGESYQQDGYRVTGVPCPARLLSNPLTTGYRRHMLRSRADVVHFHLPLPTAVASWLTIPKASRRPYVVTYHSDIVRQAFLMPLYGPILRTFLRGAEQVLATSEKYRKGSRYLRDLSNATVIPIGVDTGRFTPAEHPSEDYYLFVGRFRSYKGIEILLKAWELMHSPRRLIMAGGGPMTGAVMERIRSTGIPVTVRLDVEDSELIELYRNARALILPSVHRSEAYGMVQVEAMACGTPVISSDLQTGVSWVNAHGETGRHFTTGDPASLANAVEKLEHLSDRAVYRRSARKRAVELFDAEECLGKVEECLLKAAGK